MKSVCMAQGHLVLVHGAGFVNVGIPPVEHRVDSSRLLVMTLFRRGVCFLNL